MCDINFTHLPMHGTDLPQLLLRGNSFLRLLTRYRLGNSVRGDLPRLLVPLDSAHSNLPVPCWPVLEYYTN